MRIAIVDDDPAARDELAALLTARHDVRRHIAVMEDYATRGDTAAPCA